jgi:phosphatidylserine decarboxylase
MVPDGLYYAAGFSTAGALLAWLTAPLFALPLFLAAAFCLYFFRDPEREIPAGDVAVSPADGKVIAVAAESPTLLRVSIFMNVFDVHVNRAPIAGRVAAVEHRKGRFLVASRQAAAAENEQNTVRLEGDGTQVTFKQIAGLIARRIVFYKRPGDLVRRGERVGLIKFGSRVDVFLGPEWDAQVRPGERVRAGSSVLARRKPR